MQLILYQDATHRCESKFQDSRYGNGKRLCILQECGIGGMFTCTVCGKVLRVAEGVSIQQQKRLKLRNKTGVTKRRYWREKPEVTTRRFDLKTRHIKP